VYASDEGQRFDAHQVIAASAGGAVFYVCGPRRLLDAVRGAARAAQVPDTDVRFERFSGDTGSLAGRPLTVTLRRSRKRITVAPAQSILEAVEAAGVPAVFGCRSGTCGSCQVKVLGGEPEHRDAALSELQRSEGRLMCICISRAVGAELTLDL